MKKLNLQNFIKDIKSELQGAVDNEDPFFIMGEVELEVAFTLDVEAKGTSRFIVADIQGGIGASHSHKAKIKLIPYNFEKANKSSKTSTLRRRTAHPRKLDLSTVVINPDINTSMFFPAACHQPKDSNLKVPVRSLSAKKNKKRPT